MSNYDVSGYPIEQKQGNHFIRNMIVGGCVTAGWIAAGAFKKANRADSFVNTSKNCLRSFAVENRNGAVKLAQKLKLNKSADWIGKLSNKKSCVAHAALYTLIFGGISALASKMFSD